MKKALFAGGILTISLLSAQAFGAGFYIREQSVGALGSAFSGVASNPTGPSIQSHNPAALTEIHGIQAVNGGHLILPRAEIKNGGTTASLFNNTVQNVTVLGTNDATDEPAFVPSFFASVPIHDRVTLGLGVTAPFGLVTEYRPDWFGRYDSTYSELKTINVNPALGFKIFDWLSIGAGVNIQFAEARLEGKAPFTFLPGPGNTLGTADDFTNILEGDDYSFGGNFGIFIKPTETTNIGFHYRSKVTHRLEGEVKILNEGGELFQLFDVRAALTVPDIISLGITQKAFNDKLKIMFNADYFNWSTFDQIAVINNANNEFVGEVDVQNYRDTVTLSLGLEYLMDNGVTLKTGVSYDPTPTRDEFRSSRIPDEDRIWLTAGIDYNIYQNLFVNLSYAHIFVNEIKINKENTFDLNPGPGEILNTVNTVANADATTDIISASIIAHF